MKTKTDIGRVALASLALIALTACGGGGSGNKSGSVAPSGSGSSAAPSPTPAPPPSPTAEGLYLGTTSNFRTVSGVILDNGTYWVIYSVPNNSAIIAGAIQGTGTSKFGSFLSTDAKDFNLEGHGIRDSLHKSA